MIDRYNDFRIANRHLSENDSRENYCRRTGADLEDLDRAIWRAREERNEYYDRMDRGDIHE